MVCSLDVREGSLKFSKIGGLISKVEGVLGVYRIDKYGRVLGGLKILGPTEIGDL